LNFKACPKHLPGPAAFSGGYDKSPLLLTPGKFQLMLIYALPAALHPRRAAMLKKIIGIKSYCLKKKDVRYCC